MKKRIGLFRLNSKLYKDVSIKNENEWKKKIDIIHDQNGRPTRVHRHHVGVQHLEGNQ